MKKIVLVCLVFFCIRANGQSIVDSLSNPSFTLQDSVARRLAELALKYNPDIKNLDKQIESNLVVWRRTKTAWLGNLSASFNLNERNWQGKDSLGNIFYPRYNLNYTIPLNSFFTRPKDTKIAKVAYEMSVNAKDANLFALKERIKTDYFEYKTNLYLLALEEANVQDEAVLLSQSQQKFERNEVSLEVFTVATKRYNAEIVKKIGLLRDVITSKIRLETDLGIDLESALKMIRVRK